MTAIEWATASPSSEPPGDLYCKTRDEAQARVEKLRPELQAHGWSEDEAGLLTAVAGELTGNCFDHNLGKWPDIPGCWFEHEENSGVFRMIIADRGQGVLATLRQVRPKLKDSREALGVAFTERVSGRAPEERGNGLKFVIRSLGKISHVTSFTFITGDAKLSLTKPVDIVEIPGYIASSDQVVRGMHCELIVTKTT